MPPRIPTEDDFSPLSSTLPHTLHFPSPPESTTTFLILFHGLGDHDVPFASFAKNLNLPGVLAISVRGTSVLPAALLGGDRPGYHWGDDLTVDPSTGDIADDSGFEKARRLIMEKLIGELLIEKCGWEMRDIIFFGFGQGGSLALGLAASLNKTPRVTDVSEGESTSPGNKRFKGAISLGGPLPQSMVSTVTNRSRSSTSVLVCQLDEDAVDAVKREFDDVKVVQWKRREVSMPMNRDEVLPLMQFFADKLKNEW
ncbi:hypothetical protein ACKRZS_014855 [Fusarium odoratissimum]|uniref:Phospholipase/carboxylesterase/thioesterase domain-containing protein n=3 Tax=Fusarium oxysporum species complex TaxID=171631 RepID=X0KGR6_FUSO5|nr:uncharacterized protein FOIG_02772 [Fusarium odoratissimum NRRL 54006]EMT65059.1 Putative hydrolase C9G1.08c [Fusarium odoratissimum]EXM07851.1 hypothetical protein FOIG_02772 [Fusarium odoratissimum NRRL 54006]KAK2131019.1 hypothetical protein NOF04DRAFT_12281 [Fusarium oxysporum II5]TXC09084.1 hypothetical protein FocTR4_00004863 [Fusarium oxysporum f. sp. cubense]